MCECEEFLVGKDWLFVTKQWVAVGVVVAQRRCSPVFVFEPPGVDCGCTVGEFRNSAVYATV